MVYLVNFQHDRLYRKKVKISILKRILTVLKFISQKNGFYTYNIMYNELEMGMAYPLRHVLLSTSEHVIHNNNMMASDH